MAILGLGTRKQFLTRKSPESSCLSDRNYAPPRNAPKVDAAGLLTRRVNPATLETAKLDAERVHQRYPRHQQRDTAQNEPYCTISYEVGEG